MASGRSRFKRFSITGATNQNADINVTPLIDVVLVLLIIFMVVTPLLEKDIEVKVPETEEQPDEIPPEMLPDQLIVSISEAGQLKINAETVTDDDYLVRLKRMVAARPAGDRLVFFMPDEKVNYGKLIAALDGARQAGAETLGMMTEVVPTAQTAGTEGAPPPETPPAP